MRLHFSEAGSRRAIFFEKARDSSGAHAPLRDGETKAVIDLLPTTVLFPASRLISGAVNRRRPGDAPREADSLVSGSTTAMVDVASSSAASFGDEKRAKGDRHLVNQASRMRYSQS